MADDDPDNPSAAAANPQSREDSSDPLNSKNLLNGIDLIFDSSDLQELWSLPVLDLSKIGDKLVKEKIPDPESEEGILQAARKARNQQQQDDIDRGTIPLLQTEIEKAIFFRCHEDPEPQEEDNDQHGKKEDDEEGDDKGTNNGAANEAADDGNQEGGQDNENENDQNQIDETSSNFLYEEGLNFRIPTLQPLMSCNKKLGCIDLGFHASSVLTSSHCQLMLFESFVVKSQFFKDCCRESYDKEDSETFNISEKDPSQELNRGALTQQNGTPLMFPASSAAKEALLDFHARNLLFGKSIFLTAKQANLFCSIMAKVVKFTVLHPSSISPYPADLCTQQEAFIYFKDLLLSQFQANLLAPFEICTKIIDYVTSTFFRHFKLWQFTLYSKNSGNNTKIGPVVSGYNLGSNNPLRLEIDSFKSCHLPKILKLKNEETFKSRWARGPSQVEIERQEKLRQAQEKRDNFDEENPEIVFDDIEVEIEDSEVEKENNNDSGGNGEGNDEENNGDTTVEKGGENSQPATVVSAAAEVEEKPPLTEEELAQLEEEKQQRREKRREEKKQQIYQEKVDERNQKKQEVTEYAEGLEYQEKQRRWVSFEERHLGFQYGNLKKFKKVIVEIPRVPTPVIERVPTPPLQKSLNPLENRGQELLIQEALDGVKSRVDYQLGVIKSRRQERASSVAKEALKRLYTMKTNETRF